MLEKGKLYKIKTPIEIFSAVFLGSYYKVLNNKNDKKANKTYDFITIEGKFISKDFDDIKSFSEIEEDISEELRLLIEKYEKTYWKLLENTFLMSKLKNELTSLREEMDDVSKAIKIANNCFSLKDLMEDKWLELENIVVKYKSLKDEISMSCKLSSYIYHTEVNNCSLNCFEVDIKTLNSDIVQNIGYKIKDIKTANKLYNLTIPNEIIEKLNSNVENFTLSYNKDFNNLSITDEYVCIDILINIKFNKSDYSYEEYIELKDDLNYCLEELQNYLLNKLSDMKCLLKEVVYGAEQEKEYERQGSFDMFDLFNINLNIDNNLFNKCYC